MISHQDEELKSEHDSFIGEESSEENSISEKSDKEIQPSSLTITKYDRRGDSITKFDKILERRDDPNFLSTNTF